MKEPEKLHQLETPFQVNIWSSPQSVWKVVWHTKYTYRELRSILGLLQTNSLCAKSSHKKHLLQQHDFPFNVYKSVAITNLKEQGLLIDQDRESPE